MDTITQHNGRINVTKESLNGDQHVQIYFKWTYTSTHKLDKDNFYINLIHPLLPSAILLVPKGPKHPVDRQLI